LTFTVSANASAITLNAKKTGYNYTQFRMELKGAPAKLKDDGRAVLADVFEAGSRESEEPVAENVRMIFVPNTAPLQQLVSRGLGEGDSLNVIGIPRINLDAIFTFVNASSGKTANRKLPYEMIIVAVTGSH